MSKPYVKGGETLTICVPFKGSVFDCNESCVEEADVHLCEEQWTIESSGAAQSA